MNKSKNRILKALALMALPFVGMGGLTSCQDFFDTESSHVIYAETDHLNNATDTVYSVVGILNKLQVLGDRTVLLGEARADLVDITSATSADLRELASLNVSDDNMYNSPRDYYAVINNCNYFIAKADTALKNNRNQYIFLGEYAAVKALRAWTYLQLVTTYGRVPFVTDPILSMSDAETNHPMYDIDQVCNYFLNEDGLQDLVDVDYPQYGVIKSINSQLFFVPMRVILGDLQLWAAKTSEDYYKAAHYYQSYLSNRNGSNTAYPCGTSSVEWSTSHWQGMDINGFDIMYPSTSASSTSEAITIIPSDSIPSEGVYMSLARLFNTSADNNYQASLTPSENLINISAKQTYCYVDIDGTDINFVSAPTSVSRKTAVGDLRLDATYMSSPQSVDLQGNRYVSQIITKHFNSMDQATHSLSKSHVQVYRRQMIYLRLAEALNRAGYPAVAYRVLSTGLNNDSIKADIQRFYPEEEDSIKLAAITFPATLYTIYDPARDNKRTANTQGMHSRGSGYTPGNVDYQMPYDPSIEGTDSIDSVMKQRKWQQIAVEDLIVQEGALEFAFEGTRYYDLLRVALRRYDEKIDPSYTDKDYLYNMLHARRGAGTDAGIAVDLRDKRNWFLHWRGLIGY